MALHSKKGTKMASTTPSRRTLQGELRSVLATLQCLSEYAAEQGETQCAAILHNAASLLEVTVLPQLACGTAQRSSTATAALV